MPDTAVPTAVEAPETREDFEAFYRREREGLLRTLLFVLDEDEPAATDAFELAMTDAYSAWDQLTLGEDPTGRVVRVALAAAHARRPAGRAEDDDDTEDSADAAGDSSLAEALTRLDPQQRAALVLRFHLDWSVERIATALDEPVATIKSWLQRGMGRVRTLIAEGRMTADLEERLRKHFTDRSERLRLPSPAVNDELARIAGGAGRRRRRRPEGTGSRRVQVLGALAGVAVLGVAVGLLVSGGGAEDSDDAVDLPPRTPSTEAGVETPVPPGDAPADTVAPTPPPITGLPVVVGPFGELGWWDGSAWVNSLPGTAAPVQGGEEYKIVGLDQPPSTRVGGFSTQLCPSDTARVGQQSVDAGFGPRESWPALVPVAVSGVAEPQPRPVAVLDSGAEAYRSAAAEVLTSIGVPDANPQVIQVLRTDLDGNGYDDVLVAVERMANWEGLMGVQGDYSVVFVRRVVDDVVYTSVLAQSQPYGQPDGAGQRRIDSLRVAAIADLNGDGDLEVVLQNDHAGGRASAVYELQADGSLTAVIGRACDG